MKSNDHLISNEQVEKLASVAQNYQYHHDKALTLIGGDSDFFYEAKIKLICSQIEKPPQRVLDFGCGTGRLTRRLGQVFSHAQIFGVDPSPKNIEVAQQAAPVTRNISYITDVEKSGLSFDLIVVAGVFHHIPDSKRLNNLILLKKIMSPQAQLLIFEHNPLSIPLRLLLAWAGSDKDAELVYPWRLPNLLQQIDMTNKLRFISFFPPCFGPLVHLEPFLNWIPFGAQYMIVSVHS